MSVIPQIYNFKDHYKGSTFSPLSIKFNFNITGATITCQIKSAAKATAVIYEWKTGVNITITNLLTGDIILNQINEFNPIAGYYIYDLQIKFNDGTGQTYLRGNLNVIQDITVPTV
jgi:hypothetical protein